MYSQISSETSCTLQMEPCCLALSLSLRKLDMVLSLPKVFPVGLSIIRERNNDAKDQSRIKVNDCLSIYSIFGFYCNGLNVFDHQSMK